MNCDRRYSLLTIGVTVYVYSLTLEMFGKQKIEKEKETVRPTVINDQLIKQYMV